jgi:hypothetical protein
MRREWRRFGPGIALGAAVLVVGTAAALAATADTGPSTASASADLAGPLRGPCLLGIIGDCAPQPTPTFTVPTSTASTPGVTPTDTSAPPSRDPTPSATRSRHPHSTRPTHQGRVHATAPGPSSTRQHPRRSGSVAVAVTTSVDPSPAGTTLSASDLPPTSDPGKRAASSSGMWRPLMQLFPIVAICLVVAIVVVVTAARRGSRNNRAAAGHVRQRHRHAYSETDELAHPRALR